MASIHKPIHSTQEKGKCKQMLALPIQMKTFILYVHLLIYMRFVCIEIALGRANSFGIESIQAAS